MLSESEVWMMSFYRSSETTGALFFGRLARSMKPGAIQHDMTKHFADESMHAWYWSDTIDRLGATPLKFKDAYQDQYLEAAGMPVNLMEVLAITQVFEQRVISQYAVHHNVSNLQPEIGETLHRIMDDERWHIHWIKQALQDMETKYGADQIEATLKRFRDADREVYHQTMNEHAERITEILRAKPEVHAL